MINTEPPSGNRGRRLGGGASLANIFIGQLGMRSPFQESACQNKASDSGCQDHRSDSDANENLSRCGIRVGFPILHKPPEEHDNADDKRESPNPAEAQCRKDARGCTNGLGALHGVAAANAKPRALLTPVFDPHSAGTAMGSAQRANPASAEPRCFGKFIRLASLSVKRAESATPRMLAAALGSQIHVWESP